MRLALVVIAVGCGGSSGPVAPAPIANDAPIATRATPAPTIAWLSTDNAFDTSALPVIARAAEIAVVAVHDSDGGRGYPNLRLEVRDRNDRTIQTIAVMASSDYEKLVADNQASTELQRRIATANRELAKLHGLHDLVAMQPLAIQKPAEGTPHLAIGDDLDVDFTTTRIDVFHHGAQRPFTSTSWRVPAVPARCAGENPAFLQAVYKARDIRALVVEVAYRGTDTCWEPGNQLRVITWQ